VVSSRTPCVSTTACCWYICEDKDYASRYIVSSYIPTLAALSHARQALSPRASHEHPKILALAQPSAVGVPILPNAHTEIEAVERVVPPEMLLGTESTVTVSSVNSVLHSLPNAFILHLACHAQQDQDDPLKSGFDLADGRLTLAQLMRVHISRPQFAYLSACESAAMDVNQPDEAVNLAATMLFVGFKSIVATMW
jgi:CHAT domain-containing protein